MLKQGREWTPQVPWRKLYVKLQSINTLSFCITNFNQLLLNLHFGLLPKWISTSLFAKQESQITYMKINYL